MSHTATIDPEVVRNDYLAIWNEESEDARRSMLTRSWSRSASYLDPLMSAKGIDAIAAMINAARSAYPGFRFEPRGSADSNGHRVRFAWDLVPETGGARVGGGTDIIAFDDAQLISEVWGFLDGAAS